MTVLNIRMVFICINATHTLFFTLYHSSLSFSLRHTHTRAREPTHTDAYTHQHTYVYTHTHTQKGTHAHTQTQACEHTHTHTIACDWLIVELLEDFSHQCLCGMALCSRNICCLKKAWLQTSSDKPKGKQTQAWASGLTTVKTPAQLTSALITRPENLPHRL